MKQTPEQIIAQLTSRMQSMSTLAVAGKIYLYGPSGVGKTVAALALAQRITPPNQKILFVDFANGWASVLNHPGLEDRVDRMQFDTIADLPNVAVLIQNNLGDFGKYGCVILDELSAMAEHGLDETIKANVLKDPSKDSDTPTWPDFNAAGNRVRKVVSSFHGVPNLHCIFLSHERADKNSRNVECFSMAFQPKLAKSLYQNAHLVAYMTADTVATASGDDRYIRTFQVHPTNTVSAKTRVGGLEVKVSFDKLATTVTEWLKGKGKDNELTDPIKDTVAPTEPTDDDTLGIQLN